MGIDVVPYKTPIKPTGHLAPAEHNQEALDLTMCPRTEHCLSQGYLIRQCHACAFTDISGAM